MVGCFRCRRCRWCLVQCLVRSSKVRELLSNDKEVNGCRDKRSRDAVTLWAQKLQLLSSRCAALIALSLTPLAPPLRLAAPTTKPHSQKSKVFYGDQQITYLLTYLYSIGSSRGRSGHMCGPSYCHAATATNEESVLSHG